jgi:hypothetical protein
MFFWFSETSHMGLLTHFYFADERLVSRSVEEGDDDLAEAIDSGIKMLDVGLECPIFCAIG